MVATVAAPFGVIDFFKKILNENGLDGDLVQPTVTALLEGQGAVILAADVQGVFGADDKGAQGNTSSGKDAGKTARVQREVLLDGWDGQRWRTVVPAT